MRSGHRVVLICSAVLAVSLAACPSTDRDDDNSLCGNYIVNPGEECDDGNRVDHDGCSSTCQVEVFCGNGVVEPGEECDDGNFAEDDGCTAECHTEVGCGNGRLEVGEQCDDDNLVDGDGCDALCQDEVPGALCGNGIHELGEGCDDGNTAGGDGCGVDCKREDGCGDGVVQDPEMCDDGNTINGDGCGDTCRVEFVCGNEYCESDNYETCYLCPSDCCPDCGDGVLDEGEECDDGNNDNDDGCDKGCGDEVPGAECGNGIWEAGEECDDNNVTIHDGCSDICEVEYVCGDQVCEENMGETCERCQQDCCPNCGNGVYEPTEGEECDMLDLGGQTCSTFGCQGGTLVCTQWCTMDFSGCIGSQPTCGNDTAECFEACDASDLRGKDCYALGYDGGSLTCDAGCNYDVSGCGALLWYLWDDFEDPSTYSSWTMGTGEWEIGTIGSGDDPPTAYSGLNVMATNIGGTYSNSDTWATDRAVTPPIDLTLAIAPALRFYMWVDTETCCDGFAIFITTNGGALWSHLPNPTPAYNANVGSQQCWQEEWSSPPTAWTEVNFDLTSYAGETIQLGFSFYSDSSVTYTGPHVDDVLVAEPSAMP